MNDISKDELNNLMTKYKDKLSSSFSSEKQKSDDFNLSKDSKNDFSPERSVSQEYEDFKNEYIKDKYNLYERLCDLSEKYLKIKPSSLREVELSEAIETCHLNVTPTGVNSFPYFIFIMLIFAGMLFGYLLPSVIMSLLGDSWDSLFFVVFALIIGFILIVPLGRIPFFLANDWRMKGSNQMVLSIFYIVTYMRHTSNLELAIDFASQHLSPPLSMDLKRVIWNIETGKFDTVKDSLDAYLEGWKKTNMEFVEAMNLITSSLYESNEERRIGALEKALEVILDETYEKMLKYAHELKSPMTMITMLGVILPILSLVIAPLAINFMGGIEWYHLAAFYNVALPFGVYYLSKITLSSRPGGGGNIDISKGDQFKDSYNYTFNFLGQEMKLSLKNVAYLIGGGLFLIAAIPFILHYAMPNFDIALGDRGQYKLLDYKMVEGKIEGPFGLGSSLLSLFVPLSIAISLGFYFKQKSRKVLEIREKVRKLETEFSSALFQLGNRLGDGLPVEIAFEKVAQLMDNSITGNFFSEVANKISKMGMSVEQAIFDPKIGVLKDYPSRLIESSMKVLSESSKKGPVIASQALINVANYMKEMHRVNERVKDLMAEILSSVKGQISFLAPSLTGIVVGITSMIGTIMGELGKFSGTGDAVGQNMGLLEDMFKLGIPTYFFQAVVGVYVVQLVYVLTVMANSIENGKDIDGERYQLGINLIKSTSLYAGITISIMLLFNVIGLSILKGLN